jgi:hypothetical protein
MAHYAFLDENNIVTEVIVGIDETELIEGLDPETWYENYRGQVCKRTSYNTLENKHSQNKEPFRLNYAGVGFTYSEELDGFISPRPYASWILNISTGTWKAPVTKPNDGKCYKWNEDATLWEEIQSFSEA